MSTSLPTCMGGVGLRSESFGNLPGIFKEAGRNTAELLIDDGTGLMQ